MSCEHTRSSCLMSHACCPQIPLVMYLLTHAYFCLYHALSNMVIRRTLAATSALSHTASWCCTGFVIFSLSYVTAFMETFSISQVRALKRRLPAGHLGMLQAVLVPRPAAHIAQVPRSGTLHTITHDCAHHLTRLCTPVTG